MFKKIATGFLAVAATSALALSLPSAAFASPASHTDDDYSDYWGPDYAKYHLAKAQGYVSVNYDDDESNSAYVSGRLWDLDNRTYDEGGKCAYVKFMAEDFDYDWSTVYTKKYCGYPGYKKFSFSTDDVYTLRVKVCQVTPNGAYVSKCGPWDEIYSAE
ncbi:hypothetical protein [Nonomuraea sediminis]|uniref:hypothetical protein n=1 Tax=Nonomuraea sediminis TaxID=2835864 RepID=UPI001BDDBDFA|nr:hypothetical protein [Nonomuraea sediminis]